MYICQVLTSFQQIKQTKKSHKYYLNNARPIKPNPISAIRSNQLHCMQNSYILFAWNYVCRQIIRENLNFHETHTASNLKCTNDDDDDYKTIEC